MVVEARQQISTKISLRVSDTDFQIRMRLRISGFGFPVYNPYLSFWQTYPQSRIQKSGAEKIECTKTMPQTLEPPEKRNPKIRIQKPGENHKPVVG